MIQKQYIIAMAKEDRSYKTLTPLNTGKRYTYEEAEKKAKEMNENCQIELKMLDHTSFVVYNINTVIE